MVLPADGARACSLHDLEVVAKDEHVRPAVAVSAERSNRLQRNGHRVRDDFLGSLLAVVDELVFTAARREEDSLPLGVEVFARPEQFDINWGGLCKLFDDWTSAAQDGFSPFRRSGR